MSETRDFLYQLAQRWEENSRFDRRDTYPYRAVLDEILFHSDLRFKDYIQFQSEGEFPVRLKKWLENFPDDRQRIILFKLIRWITFIDRGQMLSLYRDAYRRVISPWLFGDALSKEVLFAPNYNAQVLSLLRQYHLFSITESFGFSDFLHANDLYGIPKPTILGEDKTGVRLVLPSLNPSIKGVIILEDFVGTGKQASGVVSEVRRLCPPEWRILFIPLIALEQGIRNLSNKLSNTNITLSSILSVSESTCLGEQPKPDDPSEFMLIRTLIKRSASRVLEDNGSLDDPPNDPFGYKGCGALLVTCHNAPNNSIPLLHHRAPNWNPLFRRVHHSKDHL